MTTTAGTHDDLPSPAPRPLPRRSREELEALAADFVNSKLYRKEPLHRRPLPKPVVQGLAATGAIALLALLAWMLWPSIEQAAPAQAVPALSEAEEWARQLEAERARKRQEMESSRQYLAKMAAAEAAQGSRPGRTAPRPSGEPTPKMTGAAASEPPAEAAR